MAKVESASSNVAAAIERLAQSGLDAKRSTPTKAASGSGYESPRAPPPEEPAKPAPRLSVADRVSAFGGSASIETPPSTSPRPSLAHKQPPDGKAEAAAAAPTPVAAPPPPGTVAARLGALHSAGVNSKRVAPSPASFATAPPPASKPSSDRSPQRLWAAGAERARAAGGAREAVAAREAGGDHGTPPRSPQRLWAAGAERARAAGGASEAGGVHEAGGDRGTPPRSPQRLWAVGAERARAAGGASEAGARGPGGERSTADRSDERLCALLGAERAHDAGGDRGATAESTEIGPAPKPKRASVPSAKAAIGPGSLNRHQSVGALPRSHQMPPAPSLTVNPNAGPLPARALGSSQPAQPSSPRIELTIVAGDDDDPPATGSSFKSARDASPSGSFKRSSEGGPHALGTRASLDAMLSPTHFQPGMLTPPVDRSPRSSGELRPRSTRVSGEARTMKRVGTQLLAIFDFDQVLATNEVGFLPEDARASVFGGPVRCAQLIEFLQWLKEREVWLAIVSHNSARLVKDALHAAGLRKLFRWVYGHDELQKYGDSKRAIIQHKLLEKRELPPYDVIAVDDDDESAADIRSLGIKVVRLQHGGGMGFTEHDQVRDWVLAHEVLESEIKLAVTPSGSSAASAIHTPEGGSAVGSRRASDTPQPSADALSSSPH